MNCKINVKEYNLHHSTVNVRIHMRFFIILATWKHAFTQKVSYTQLHTQLETGVITIGKMCKADFAKSYIANGMENFPLHV